mgnify:CR=1 FL=1
MSLPLQALQTSHECFEKTDNCLWMKSIDIMLCLQNIDDMIVADISDSSDFCVVYVR